MTSLSPDLETQMLARTRRHMITSLGGIPLCIASVGLTGYLARGVFNGDPPGWIAVLPVLGFLLIPAMGFWSTYRNLRCPACERMVAFQVSTHYSLFGASASRQCRHCGATIFGDGLYRRFRRMMFVMMGFGVVGFLSVIVANVVANR